MQPAKEERAEGAAVVALRAEIEQQKQGCQHEAGDDSIAQRSKDLSHFHSPRRISPTRREVMCGSADFTLRRLDGSGPERFRAAAGNCRGGRRTGRNGCRHAEPCASRTDAAAPLRAALSRKATAVTHSLPTPSPPTVPRRRWCRGPQRYDT